ncbi:hypothetical protein Landi51_12786 [Colletotrichum acutatum]
MASQSLLHTLRRQLPGIITRPSPFPTTTPAPPQTRLFSHTSTLRAKVVHPDIDRYIRYSLRDGPPRTSRPKPLFSLAHQCPWPKIIPMTAASASFTSAFQPTLSQRRASSSSSITSSSLDAKRLKDEEDKKELYRQMQLFGSQQRAFLILQEDLTDRLNHVNKRTGNLSRYRELQRNLSHLEALRLIGKRMESRSNVLIELCRRCEAGETIFTGDDEYDDGGGITKEDIPNSVTQSLYEFWKSSKGPRTEEVGEEESASGTSPYRNAAEVKSEGGDEELPELQYLVKP